MAAQDVLINLDFKKAAELQNPLIHKLAADPEGGVAGQVYYNTADKRFKGFNGTSWIYLDGTSIEAGDALTLTSYKLDVAAGTGLEISADTIRIAAVAAGNGLAGGGGSALSVNTGTGLEVSADAVRIAAAAAGSGLIGGAGSALAVGAGTGITVNADDVAVNTSVIATKEYVESVAQGLDAKASVRAATTANIAIATALNSGDVLDGVTLANGDRVLVKDQTTKAENGIWVVGATPERAKDADGAGELSGGTYVFVEEGTANADTGWVIITNGSITPGTTAHEWSQFTGAGSIVGGEGLTKTGSTLDVNVGAGLEISSDAVRIAAAAAGAGLTGGAGSALAVGAGTGISVAADAVSIDTAVVVRKFAANVGNGAATEFEVEHGLSTEDVAVEVYRNSGAKDTVGVLVGRVSASKIKLTFNTAPTANQFRVVVQG